jgi:energy-coupling factor transport system ATP-binding protein
MQKVQYSRDGRTILKDITLSICEGEAVALIGPNGAGKTTLLKHLNGLLRPEKGSVYLMGKPITGRDPSELASILQLSFQNPHDQFFRYRVRDELAVGARALGREDPIRMEELIDLFNLEDLLDRSPFRLSEGEKKRAALASVLGAKPKVLVLDEPTAGQDGRFRTGLADLLRRLQERGITILMATHDLAFAEAAADRWILLEEGEVTADGPPEDLRMKERLQAQGLIRGRGGWEHV